MSVQQIVDFDRLDAAANDLAAIMKRTVAGEVSAPVCDAVAKAGFGIAKLEETKLRGRLAQSGAFAPMLNDTEPGRLVAAE